ncbi:MAG: hypothetical protein MJE63_17535 [Proteobacteria bacterium]|nr:hypothetical protein [Pseudomonadota bacterium]
MKLIIKLLRFVALVLIICPVWTYASQNKDVNWKYMNFSAKLESPYNEANIEIKCQAKSRSCKLQSISVRIGEHVIPFPKKVFEDLPEVDLKKTAFRYSLSAEYGGLFVLWFEVDSTSILGGETNWKFVRFVIHDFELNYRHFDSILKDNRGNYLIECYSDKLLKNLCHKRTKL